MKNQRFMKNVRFYKKRFWLCVTIGKKEEKSEKHRIETRNNPKESQNFPATYSPPDQACLGVRIWSQHVL